MINLPWLKNKGENMGKFSMGNVKHRCTFFVFFVNKILDGIEQLPINSLSVLATLLQDREIVLPDGRKLTKDQ
jgi:hypothetical protein